MLLTAVVALRNVLHRDAEVGPRMRLVPITVVITFAVLIAVDITGAVLGAGAKVRIDRGSVLAGIEIPIAGNFLSRGLRRGKTGLRRYLERRVVAAAALPRNSVRGGIGSALRSGLRILILRECNLGHRE